MGTHHGQVSYCAMICRVYRSIYTLSRNYQLIATGCKDRRVRIFKLTEESNEGTLSQFRVALVAELDETEGHDSEVWSVEWNLTGSILASSGDDGRVILWKGESLISLNLVEFNNICSRLVGSMETHGSAIR